MSFYLSNFFFLTYLKYFFCVLTYVTLGEKGLPVCWTGQHGSKVDSSRIECKARITRARYFYFGKVNTFKLLLFLYFTYLITFSFFNCVVNNIYSCLSNTRPLIKKMKTIAATNPLLRYCPFLFHSLIHSSAGFKSLEQKEITNILLAECYYINAAKLKTVSAHCEVSFRIRRISSS